MRLARRHVVGAPQRIGRCCRSPRLQRLDRGQLTDAAADHRPPTTTAATTTAPPPARLPADRAAGRRPATAAPPGARGEDRQRRAGAPAADRAQPGRRRVRGAGRGRSPARGRVPLDRLRPGRSRPVGPQHRHRPASAGWAGRCSRGRARTRRSSAQIARRAALGRAATTPAEVNPQRVLRDNGRRRRTTSTRRPPTLYSLGAGATEARRQPLFPYRAGGRSRCPLGRGRRSACTSSSATAACAGRLRVGRRAQRLGPLPGRQLTARRSARRRDRRADRAAERHRACSSTYRTSPADRALARGQSTGARATAWVLTDGQIIDGNWARAAIDRPVHAHRHATASPSA